jgi:hypothetical protein
MKFSIFAGFLLLWLSSILVPAIVTIVNMGEESVIVIGHNEEEQQESGKKDTSEEKISATGFQGLLPTTQSESNSPSDGYIKLIPSHIQKITLPPPEYIG